MKYLLMLLIRGYWMFIPVSKRRKCIFEKSCSNYVFESTQKEGFLKGIVALCYRYQNCRSGFQIYRDPIDNQVQMILPNQDIVDEKQIAKSLLNQKI